MHALFPHRSAFLSSPPLKMPQTSDKQQLVNTINKVMHHVILASLTNSSVLANANYHHYIEDLFLQASYLSRFHYINRRLNGSADQLSVDSIDQFLNYPDYGFLVNFCMMSESFWVLVELLEERERSDYWCQNDLQSKPSHEQIAVALYTLGSTTGGLERIHMKLNVGKGTVYTYVWRTITLLATLSDEFIQWPSPEAWCQQQAAQGLRQILFSENA